MGRHVILAFVPSHFGDEGSSGTCPLHTHPSLPATCAPTGALDDVIRGDIEVYAAPPYVPLRF
jgi:hypothetical protein